MKRLILSVFTALLTTFLSCDQVDKWTQFDIDYQTSVTVSPTLGVDIPISIPTPPITTNTESTFEANQTGKNLIETIRLNKLKLRIESPENGDFDFLKSLEIYISADGLPESKIAWKEQIPENSDELTLDVSDINLKDYILKDEIVLKLKSVTKALIAKEYKINVDAVFFVDARIFGI